MAVTIDDNMIINTLNMLLPSIPVPFLYLSEYPDLSLRYSCLLRLSLSLSLDRDRCFLDLWMGEFDRSRFFLLSRPPLSELGDLDRSPFLYFFFFFLSTLRLRLRLRSSVFLSFLCGEGGWLAGLLTAVLSELP